MRRFLVAGVVAFGAVLASASPAAAHAELRSTEPPAGSELSSTPRRVVLGFSEPVEVSFGSIRVFDGSGRRLDEGQARHPDGRSDAVALDLPPLDRGVHVVTWRVVSVDGHPVRGAFSFRMGAAPAGGDDSRPLVRRLLNAEGGSVAVGGAHGAMRFALFAGLVVLVGGVAFVLLLWPAGAGVRAVRRLMTSAWVAVTVATVAGLGLQGAYAGGLDLADALRPSVVGAVLDTRFGRVSAARLALLALAVPLLVVLVRRPPAARPSPGLMAAAGLVGLGLLATPGLAGHAAGGSDVVLAEAADLVHLAGGSLWLGGLVVLAGVVLPRRDPTELAGVVPRFSRLALGCVVVILASGAAQSLRQVGGLDALRHTTYGRLLLVKLALFAVMVGLAVVSRRWVRRRVGGSGAEPTVDGLRRSVLAEVAVGAAVLGVTALLVNAVPARSALAQPYSAELTADGLLVDVTVDPAKVGRADVHLYTLTPEGVVRDVVELTATLSLPEHDIGPLPVPLQWAGPGHFSAIGAELPLAGRWRLAVVARLTDVDQVRASTIVPVR